MDDAWILVAGAVTLVAATWTSEMVIGGPRREVHLSTDEKIAFRRTEEALLLIADGDLPQLDRLQILRLIVGAWRSARVIALHSGKPTAVPWLVAFATLCVVLSLKTVLRPNASDLRYLLGSREFLSYFVVAKRGSDSNSIAKSTRKG